MPSAFPHGYKSPVRCHLCIHGTQAVGEHFHFNRRVTFPLHTISQQLPKSQAQAQAYVYPTLTLTVTLTSPPLTAISVDPVTDEYEVSLPSVSVDKQD